MHANHQTIYDVSALHLDDGPEQVQEPLLRLQQPSSVQMRVLRLLHSQAPLPSTISTSTASCSQETRPPSAQPLSRFRMATLRMRGHLSWLNSSSTKTRDPLKREAPGDCTCLGYSRSVARLSDMGGRSGARSFFARSRWTKNSLAELRMESFGGEPAAAKTHASFV